MSDRNASSTALGTLYMRAVHQLLDEQPRILDDPIALSVLGETAVQQIRDAAQRCRTPEACALRAHVVLRSRFAEDRLATAVGRGITQYVILGAGFDTFALRQPAWAQVLKIFEVDHPGTQAVKRSRLASAGLTMPPNAYFASIDFEHESLREGLLRHFISLTEPTFFSWLGVTIYLRENAVDAVLRSVAEFPAGSEIVLTFTQPAAGAASGFQSSLAQRVAGVGEPFVSYFAPEEIEAKLRGAGFAQVEFLSPSEAEALYFRQRPRDLLVPGRTAIVYALV